MTEFDGKCPFCRSDNTEVSYSTTPEWGNNDEGDMIERWVCMDCHRMWDTEARVNVVHRKLEMIIFCPYCGKNDKLELMPQDWPQSTLKLYECSRCNRDFAIHTEEHYRREYE